METEPVVVIEPKQDPMSEFEFKIHQALTEIKPYIETSKEVLNNITHDDSKTIFYKGIKVYLEGFAEIFEKMATLTPDQAIEYKAKHGI